MTQLISEFGKKFDSFYNSNLKYVSGDWAYYDESVNFPLGVRAYGRYEPLHPEVDDLEDSETHKTKIEPEEF